MASPEITKEDVKLPKDFEGCLAFVLYNVFSKKECDEYIKIAEKKGFEVALLNAGGNRQILATDVRNSSRCIWDSFAETEKMWNRIKPFVPEVWCYRKVLGLNERLRILRYDPGEYFKPHYDGVYQRDNGERSYITVQIYLNEGFKGGSTTFLGVKTDERVEVVPKTGSVLVFEHPILHEGSELISGRKYTIRTDVMFSQNCIKPKTKPESNSGNSQNAKQSETKEENKSDAVKEEEEEENDCKDNKTATKKLSNFFSKLFT